MNAQREVKSVGDEGEDAALTGDAMPRDIKVFRVAAAICLLVGGVFSMALPFSVLVPEQFWNTSDRVPSWTTRSAAATALIPAVIISVTAFHSWWVKTTDGLVSTQRVALWSGAVGALLMFTGWIHFTEDAQEGFVGSIFLLLIAGGGVLLQPVVRWSKAKDDREREAAAQRALRKAIEEALAASRSDLEVPVQADIRAGGLWRRLWCRRRDS